MKITQETINKLNVEDGKKAIPIIATGTVRVKEKFSEREKAILDALRAFSIGTRKTGKELTNAINKVKGRDFFKYNEIVTDREILNACKYLQAEEIGFTSKLNNKDEFVYTRLEWADFVALDVNVKVKSLEEQRKEKAERDAKKEADKRANDSATLDAILASNGYTEEEIERIKQIQALRKVTA